jgi:hypothetical protein
MARKLDELQLRELADFVNQLGEAAGYATTAEWAREAGWFASSLSEVRNGKAGIDGLNLLKLMRAAAGRIARSDRDGDVIVIGADGTPVIAIETKAARPSESAASQPTPDPFDVRLEELAATGVDVLKLQRQLLKEQKKIRDRLDQLEQAGAAPATPTKRRRGSAQ